MRLAVELAQVGTSSDCLFVTLTCGDVVPDCKPELDCWREAIGRRCLELGLCGFWHLEFQRARPGVFTAWNDQVPHWHLLLWGGGLELGERLASWWREYTVNPCPAAADVREGDAARAGWYFAMHAQKEGQTPVLPVGRWWGFIDREGVRGLQHLEPIARAVSGREVIWLKRIFRRMTGARGSLGEQGFSWFLRSQDHARVLSCVEKICNSHANTPF